MSSWVRVEKNDSAAALSRAQPTRPPHGRCLGLDPSANDLTGGQVTIAAGEDTAVVSVWVDHGALRSDSNPWVLISITDPQGAKAITRSTAATQITN